jgi:hypothetical protein
VAKDAKNARAVIMTKQELIDKLILNHQQFTAYFSKLDDQDFIFSLNDVKWSAGQQADHILRSLSPLKMLLGFPKWLVKLVFKRANRPSKSYEKLIDKYLERLDKGGRASGRFVPGRIEPSSKIALSRKIENTVLKLCKSLNKYAEEEIDELVLPHPLLGKLTLREMMYFTIYHVEHHHKLAMQFLSSK